ncbi:High mobility group B protein 6 [Acorus calamus]|uniref:High mobility group B protein 6 n=1 Tax=Acorus calamus TaxID=4465 RepID=A0AAV9CD04_ACOCL|nr:High mobility group B protein 6 [Acorus calamus]
MATVAKKGRSRKALEPKNPSESETNIVAGEAEKEVPSLASPRKKKPTSKAKEAIAAAAAAAAAAEEVTVKKTASFEEELQEMQQRLEQLRLEKEKTEDLLKEKDEMLKVKGEEQERLQAELKKLHKIKEFKPTLSLSLIQTLKDTEQENEKKKKKKDGSEMKKPSPAYILWCKDQWNEIKKENSSIEFKEMSNILGAKWKNLSTEEKKPYEEKYQAEKEAYLQIIGKEKREKEAMKLLEDEQKQKSAMELLEQYLNFKQDSEKETKKKKKEKDPLKPKQPPSAFFVFSNERRPVLLKENKNILEVAKHSVNPVIGYSITLRRYSLNVIDLQIAKLAGEEWKNMTEKERAPYEKIAKKQKEDYLQKMELYKQNKADEAAALEKEEEEQKKVMKQEALQLLKKKEKTDNIIKFLIQQKTKESRQKKENVVDPNKPKRPASAFLLFSKEARKNLTQERPGISNSTLSALISVKWKELCEEEKQVWSSQAAKAMAAYKSEMIEYNKSLPVAEGQK